MSQFDVKCCVIGAGVIGLAIARQLARHWPDLLILEQHPRFGSETSSRNSEVIHAGIYYPDRSLKAHLCVQGKQLLRSYCRENHIPYADTGKLLIAVHPAERPKLEQLARQATLNGVRDLIPLSAQQVQTLEPEIQAQAGLFSPSTGIIDSHGLMLQLLADAQRQGAQLVCHQQIRDIRPLPGGGYELTCVQAAETYPIRCEYLINAAGLQASILLSKTGAATPHTYWCKGHYFSLQGKQPFRHLIYPMPEKAGLGIHATLNLAGQVRFGPDAKYVERIDYQVPDKLREGFAQAIRRYYPALQEQQLVADYAGIRPKLQGPNTGFADFEILRQGNSLHLLGIESPGLTSCLAIAELCERLILH